MFFQTTCEHTQNICGNLSTKEKNIKRVVSISEYVCQFNINKLFRGELNPCSKTPEMTSECESNNNNNKNVENS